MDKQTGKKTVELPSSIFKRYIFMIIACFSYALSLRLFLIPNNIIAGGISGAASLIEIISKGKIHAGVCIVALNIPIMIWGLKLMGWKFILRSFITTATLGVCTDILALFITESITDNLILAGVYGGIVQGLGLGLFIKFEMSSGGTELLGRLINHKIPALSIATYTAIFDGIVIILGSIVMKNIENVLYALILVFVTAKVSDMIVFGLSSAKLCYIITTKADDISNFLISTSRRGVTLIQGEGMYTKTPKGVLLTCVKNSQITQLKLAVKQLDENAFVIVCQANEVYGKGFHSI